MPIKTIDQQRLDTIYADNKGRYEGRKEDYFALLYLTRRFKVDVDEIAHQVAFYGNDYGIDAYFFDREARNLYLFQFKWSDDHTQFRGSMERLAKDGLPRIFGNPNQDPKQNDLLGHLRKDLKEHRELIDRVYVHFVFKGDVDAAERSEGLANRVEDIVNKAYLLNTFFGRDVELQPDFIADKPGHKTSPPGQSYVVHIQETVSATHDGRVMHVGFVPLMDLYGIFKGLGQTFFDRNIRATLSPDNAPNKKIRDALDKIVLKENDQASVFAFRHNGVTLAAERVNLANNTVALYVPRLLNGAQTVSSVARFLEDKEDNPLLQRNRGRLNEIKVLAKIIEDQDLSGEFVTQVTISNNQQNPVSPWALRAMDVRQVDLADKFLDELGIFYSRQEGSFENLSDDDREELGIEDPKAIQIRPLAQTFLAIQGDINNMAHLPDVFESQTLYTNTFKTVYLNSDARSIVLAYKVGLRMSGVTARIKESFAQKYQPAVPKARNLIWALLVQALFNDKKFESYRDDYGSTLAKEAAFRDILKQLTGSRIVPLLKELLGSPTYKDKIAQDKYDFLRSTESFKKTMNSAMDKYGWKKKSF
jgi:hypothetical protein